MFHVEIDSTISGSVILVYRFCKTELATSPNLVRSKTIKNNKINQLYKITLHSHELITINGESKRDQQLNIKLVLILDSRILLIGHVKKTSIL